MVTNMWIIVATVLLLYLLGFLFICFLNAENHRPSDNNSISASNNNDETENFCQRQHLGRYHRLFHSRLLSSHFPDDEEDAAVSRHTATPQQSRSTDTRQGQNLRSSEPSRSALFAYRQQQLRQIHHEINEMSYLLGTSQNQSDQRSQSVPVPITSRANFIQPLLSSTSNYFNVCGAGRSRYSFVHQLMSPLPPSPSTSCSTSLETTDPATTTRETVMMSANTCNIANNISNTGTPGGSIAYHSCGSSSLSYSPSGSESCHIFQERQRRLRHIRMELEGLSLQLSHVDDQSVSSTTPPLMTGNASTRGSLLMSVSPVSAGTTFRTESNLADSSSSLIYFSRGNASDSIINGNSWSDDDLPGYESIVSLVDGSVAVAELGSEERAEESPPPSYNDVVHLYSFGERESKRK